MNCSPSLTPLALPPAPILLDRQSPSETTNYRNDNNRTPTNNNQPASLAKTIPIEQQLLLLMRMTNEVNQNVLRCQEQGGTGVTPYFGPYPPQIGIGHTHYLCMHLTAASVQAVWYYPPCLTIGRLDATIITDVSIADATQRITLHKTTSLTATNQLR